MQKPKIIFNQVCYSVPSGDRLLDHVDLVFSAKKTGLIGRNGVGKTTLLRLIIGEISPISGIIQTEQDILYIPQNSIISQHTTVAGLLGYKDKIDAFHRIKNGSTDPRDYSILNENWQVEDNLAELLRTIQLDHIAHDTNAGTLSSGTVTKLLLLNAFSSQAQFLLLDEPTNHLDSQGRAWLYRAISQWDRGLIVVSHDRELLNLLEEIVEIKNTGIAFFTGDYDSYLGQKEIEDLANQRELHEAESSLRRASKSIQSSREKQEQKQQHGKKQKAGGSLDKIGANAKKSASDKSKSNLKIKAERLITTAESRIQTAKDKIENTLSIALSLPETSLPSGKVVIDIENISYHYPGLLDNVIQHFNLKLVGSERIALSGPNGSGKTTLVKLILGDIVPTMGNIYIGTPYISYLDQNTQQLLPDLSLLDNFMRINPTATINDAYRSLAQFLFRNTSALKKASSLSGGERLRALLSCVLLKKHPPQLLILDEPTNHLDIDSIKCVEDILNQYQGAMIVISHDKHFLENIGIEYTLQSPFFSV